MKCQNCGQEIAPGKLFCGYCGTRVEPEEIISTPKVIPQIKDQKTTKPAPIAIPQPEEKKTPKLAPKWLFWLIGGIVLIGVILLAIVFILIPAQKRSQFDEKLALGLTQTVIAKESNRPDVSQPTKVSTTSRVESNLTEDIAGEWAGEIRGDNFSALIEISIEENCQIGSLCGTYAIVDGNSRGQLELVKISGSEYHFLEHPIIEENIEGSGYQIMSLIDNRTLKWSFQQESSGDSFFQSSGNLAHAEDQ